VAGAEYRRPITLSSSQKFPGKIFFLNRYGIGIIIYYFYTRVIYIYLIIYTMVLKRGYVSSARIVGYALVFVILLLYI